MTSCPAEGAVCCHPAEDPQVPLTYPTSDSCQPLSLVSALSEQLVSVSSTSSAPRLLGSTAHLTLQEVYRVKVNSADRGRPEPHRGRVYLWDGHQPVSQPSDS